MGNESCREYSTGSSREELDRLLAWCINQSIRLDDQFQSTQSVLLSTAAMPSTLSALDSHSLIVPLMSHVSPLLLSIDELLNNRDPIQLPLSKDMNIEGYSTSIAHSNMAGLASNIEHDDTQKARKERGLPALTPSHTSCRERMEVTQKYLVLQALLAKMTKASIHLLKCKERVLYYQARLSSRHRFELNGNEMSRMTTGMQSLQESMTAVLVRLDRAKETMEWLWRDYRLAMSMHQLNETLRVLRGIQRKSQGKQSYSYPRQLGLGTNSDSYSGSNSGNGSAKSHTRRLSQHQQPSAQPQPQTPLVVNSSTSQPFSVVTPSAATPSTMASPPLRFSVVSPTSNSTFKFQQSNIVTNTATATPSQSHYVQSLNSLYSSTPHSPPNSMNNHHDMNDINYWIYQLERRQQLVDFACQCNERSALLSALKGLDEQFTVSVSTIQHAHMSPRLVALLHLQHRTVLTAADIRRAIVNMNNRLQTFDHAIIQLKTENVQLYKLHGQEAIIARNHAQMNVILEEAEIEKRACRDLFRFFHASVAHYVYSRLDSEVTGQCVDVQSLYKDLQRVDKACIALFGHVNAEAPPITFSLTNTSRSSASDSVSISVSDVPKVTVHYDRQKHGVIEEASFDDSKPVLSPKNRRIAPAIVEEKDGMWRESSELGDSDGDEKEIIVVKNRKHSPRSPSFPPSPRDAHHSRSRSAEMFVSPNASNERLVNDMKARRRRSQPLERKENAERKYNEEFEPALTVNTASGKAQSLFSPTSFDVMQSTVSTPIVNSIIAARDRSNRPLSADFAVGGSGSASGALSPTDSASPKPNLPPRPRCASSMEGTSTHAMTDESVSPPLPCIYTTNIDSRGQPPVPPARPSSGQGQPINEAPRMPPPIPASYTAGSQLANPQPPPLLAVIVSTAEPPVPPPRTAISAPTPSPSPSSARTTFHYAGAAIPHAQPSPIAEESEADLINASPVSMTGLEKKVVFNDRHEEIPATIIECEEDAVPIIDSHPIAHHSHTNTSTVARSPPAVVLSAIPRRLSSGSEKIFESQSQSFTPKKIPEFSPVKAAVPASPVSRIIGNKSLENASLKEKIAMIQASHESEHVKPTGGQPVLPFARHGAVPPPPLPTSQSPSHTSSPISAMFDLSPHTKQMLQRAQWTVANRTQ